jgi:hypothetical protein
LKQRGIPRIVAAEDGQASSIIHHHVVDNMSMAELMVLRRVIPSDIERYPESHSHLVE